ncbi:hypothetical protein IFM89_008850, partial [Coptis chinensis]
MLVEDCVVTAVHVDSLMVNRRIFWTVETLKPDSPWLVIGDFNVVLQNDEKKGAPPPRRTAIADFLNWFNTCELQRSDHVGLKYTWCNNQHGHGRILARLDRAFYNQACSQKFAGWRYKVGTSEGSDHAPLLGAVGVLKAHALLELAQADADSEPKNGHAKLKNPNVHVVLNDEPVQLKHKSTTSSPKLSKLKKGLKNPKVCLELFKEKVENHPQPSPVKQSLLNQKALVRKRPFTLVDEPIDNSLEQQSERDHTVAKDVVPEEPHSFATYQKVMADFFPEATSNKYNVTTSSTGVLHLDGENEQIVPPSFAAK